MGGLRSSDHSAAARYTGRPLHLLDLDLVARRAATAGQAGEVLLQRAREATGTATRRIRPPGRPRNRLGMVAIAERASATVRAALIWDCASPAGRSRRLPAQSMSTPRLVELRDAQDTRGHRAARHGMDSGELGRPVAAADLSDPDRWKRSKYRAAAGPVARMCRSWRRWWAESVAARCSELDPEVTSIMASAPVSASAETVHGIRRQRPTGRIGPTRAHRHEHPDDMTPRVAPPVARPRRSSLEA